MLQFRENANKYGVCSEYSQRWYNCQSKKQLADLGLSVQGIEYLCESISRGWGLSPEILSKQFSKYINGAYVFDNNSYTTKMYCCFDGSVISDTTALCIISSNVEINVPERAFSEVFITGKSNVKISGSGRCSIVVYGDSVVLSIEDGSTLQYKILHNTKNE